MTTDTTPTPNMKELEANKATAQATQDTAEAAYKTLMAQGPDADFEEMRKAMNAVVDARAATKRAEAEITKAQANVRWMELVNVNRGVMDILKGVTLPEGATGLTGKAMIEADGTIKVDGSFTFGARPTPDTAAISAFVTANKAEYAKRNVTGLSFAIKSVTHEDGTTAFEPEVRPVGVMDGIVTRSERKAAAGEGGKGSNEYVDPAGNVHTAREAIDALRSTYKGKQESIDNALASNNGVRNIAISLCGANGWTVRKAS